MPGDPSRLFVVEQKGLLRVILNGNLLVTPHSELIPSGTLPTCMTPNADPPISVVQNYKNVVAEWKISPTDSNLVEPASRREFISFGVKRANITPSGTATTNRAAACRPASTSAAWRRAHFTRYAVWY